MYSGTYTQSNFCTGDIGMLIHFFEKFVPFPNHVIDVAIPTKAHSDMQIRNSLPQNLLDSFLSRNGKTVHERTSNCNVSSKDM